MKTSITKICTFAAAHSLPNHQGRCRNLHGHTYTLEVTVEGAIREDGPAAGMVLDFADLEQAIEDLVLSRLDHSYLNEVLEVVPTAEAIAGWVFTVLRQRGLPVNRVRLWESPTSHADVTE